MSTGGGVASLGEKGKKESLGLGEGGAGLTQKYMFLFGGQKKELVFRDLMLLRSY